MVKEKKKKEQKELKYYPGPINQIAADFHIFF